MRFECRNAEPGEICLCPRDGNVRAALRHPVINGWLGEGLCRAANALAADETVADERLWRMLHTLENDANGALCMWRWSQ